VSPARHSPIPEAAALRLLLVEAVETADPEGRLLGRAERAQASREAQAAGEGDPAAVLVTRAETLAGLLAARVPALRAALRVPRLPVGGVLAVVLGAGVLGLASHALGPERHINILSLPLLGLLAWNLAVYAALATAAIRGALGRATGGARTARPAVGSGVGRAILRLAERSWRAARAPDAEAAAVLGPALGAYAGAWRRTLAPLWAMRVQGLLHLGSAALGTGMLLGMYLRGIAFEYRATWESTFLGPGNVRALLGVVFGPASALLGRPLPDVEGLAAIRFPEGGDAAPWIHLYAATTILWVIVPRAVLATAAAWRARRLAADLPIDLDTPYARRLLAAGRGAETRVEVIPYSYHLEPRAAETLAAALRDAAGHRADLRIRAPAEYGAGVDDLLDAEPPDIAHSASGERWLAVVFALAQTPEPEVHGELLAGLLDWVAVRPASRRVVVLVDGARYRARLAGTGAVSERLHERRRAWDRVARQAGLPAVHVDLDAAPDGDTAVAAIDQGLWPTVAVGAGR
jgi:Protein of unknown function (DUF2868)